MEPAGLGLAVLTAYKELYLTVKFIHRLVFSAKHYKMEREDLRQEFHLEVLYLQSFGQLLIENNGILKEDKLNAAWLGEIFSIFERLRLHCGDHAKLAAAQDKDYQTYSPYLHHSTAVSGVIEFSFDVPSDSSKVELLEMEFSTPKKLNIGGWFSTRSSANWDSWRWALFERRKLERFVGEFQKWTSKIKDLVPLMMALNPHYNNSLVLDKLITNEHSQRVGVAPHACLRRLAIEPGLDQTNFFLENATLDAPLDTTSLNIAHLLHGSRQEPEKVLVEYKRYSGSDMDDVESKWDPQTEERVHQLASLLSSAGTQGLHTLEFRGLVHQREERRYAFIFKFPPPLTPDQVPTSLYSMMTMLGSKFRLSLPQRFRVARDVVTAVSAFHADGWVHKSIRSHSIMFFPNSSSTSSPAQSNEVLFGDCYLVDFEFARPENAITQYTYDDHWEKKLYRHPERQGPPTVSFRKIHDIYSLGVVLLEIGLWQTATTIYEQASKKLKPAVNISPRGIQNVFIEIAKRQLPHNMGPAYCDAVINCLSGSGFHGDEENWVMMFYEDVVQNIDVAKLQ